MKLRAGDYIFVIVYLIILISLLYVTPVTLGGGYDGVEESTPYWSGISWLLLYMIAVPILYLVLRRFLYPKKKTDQP